MSRAQPARGPVPSLLLAIVGLAVYLTAFYAVEMPSMRDATGNPFPRVGFFVWLSFHGHELLEFWCGSPPQFSLLDRLPVLTVAAAIFTWAVVLGWLLVSLFVAFRSAKVAAFAERKATLLDRPILTKIETFVFSAAVGLNALSTYVLAVGLLGWLGSRIVFLLPAAITLVAAAWLWQRKRRHGQPDLSASALRPGGKTDADETPDWLSPHWLWWAVPLVALIFLGGMLPPVDFDVREYHLQAPKEFFQQGSIGFLPHNVYANMPLGTEMLSLLGMVLVGDWWQGALVGKTLIAAFTPLTALGLFAAGRRFFSPAAGIVAVIVYLSIPWIVRVSTAGLVEGAYACYLLLAVYAALLWAKERLVEAGPREDESQATPRRGRKAQRNVRASTAPSPHPGPLPRGEGGRSHFLLLAGYLSGAAVACKYPAMLFVVLPLASFLLWPGIRLRNRNAWKPAAVFLLAVLVGCGLWFAKNAVLTGNPTYPLFYSLFDGKTWNADKNRQWSQVHQPHDFSSEALASDLARVALTSEWSSPVLVPLALLALANRRRRNLVLLLGSYFAYVVAGWWLLTHRIDRFWVPALPLVALLAGVGVTWSDDRAWRWTVRTVLTLAVAYGLLVAGSVGGYNRYFVPLADLRVEAARADQPGRVDPWHLYLNQHAQAGRVLLVGDAQPFDLEVPVLYNTCFDDSIFERLVKDRSPHEVRSSFTELGITHVLVQWGQIARYRTTYGFTEFVQPEVFDCLVEQSVLSPLPEIPGHVGRGYRVNP